MIVLKEVKRNSNDYSIEQSYSREKGEVILYMDD